MIYLFYDDKNRVSLTYYVEPTEELKSRPHLAVESVADPEEKPGKIAVLCADDQHYWYEYKDKPLTDDDRIGILENAMGDMMVMLGGMQ